MSTCKRGREGSFVGHRYNIVMTTSVQYLSIGILGSMPTNSRPQQGYLSF